MLKIYSEERSGFNDKDSSVRAEVGTGRTHGKLESARKLLAEGLLSIEKIIELTGLSREEIEQH